MLENEDINFDFAKLTESINGKSEEIKNVLKTTFDPLTVLTMSEFRERVELEMNSIEVTLTGEKPTINDIKELFKEMKTIPAELQKKRSKKHAGHLESSNITMFRKDSTASLNSLSEKTMTCSADTNNSNSSSNKSSIIIDEVIPKPFDVYNDFKASMIKIDELEKSLIEKNEQKFANYNLALEKIKKFLMDMEKLLPTMKKESIADAFVKQEEETLAKIANAMDEYIFIQENQDLFKCLEEISDETLNEPNAENLDCFMNIVNELLHKTISFN